MASALHHSAYSARAARARSPAELDEMIRQGRVQFAVTIPGDFTRRVARGDQAQVLVEADATDPSATGGAVGAPGRPSRPDPGGRPNWGGWPRGPGGALAHAGGRAPC